jgi:hypothetical protein
VSPSLRAGSPPRDPGAVQSWSELRWGEGALREKTHTCTFLEVNPVAKGQLWEDDIKMYLREIGWNVVDSVNERSVWGLSIRCKLHEVKSLATLLLIRTILHQELAPGMGFSRPPL